MATTDKLAEAIRLINAGQDMIDQGVAILEGGTVPAPEPQPEPTPEPGQPVALKILEGYDTLQVVNYVKDGFVRGVNTETMEIALPAKYDLRNYLDVIQTTKRGLNIMKGKLYRLDGNVQLVSIGVALDPVAEGYPQSVIVKNKGVSVSGPTPVPGGSEPAPTPTPTPEPTPQPAPAFQRRAKGNVALNIGVGAGGDGAIPGIEDTNYFMTKPNEMDRALALGVKKFRSGYLEGRIFKRANSTDYWQGNDVTQPTWGRVMTLDHLWRIGKDAADLGMEAMIDNQSYGWFPSNGASPKYLLGSAENTIEMWVNRCYKLLELLMSKPESWKGIKRFDVINEPKESQHNAAFLAKAYMALLDKCVPLTGKSIKYSLNSQQYSSMSGWAGYAGDHYDALIAKYRDVIEFSAHGYLDKNLSGYFDLNRNGVYEPSEEVLRAGETWETVHLSRAQNFVEWLKAKNVDGSVGETVAPGNFPKFMQAQRNLMVYLLDNGVDVYTFALGNNLDKKSEHNIETTSAQSGGSGLDMTAMLNLVKELAAKYNK